LFEESEKSKRGFRRDNNVSCSGEVIGTIGEVHMKAQPHPLVSIVTPAYNEEMHLAECIESVLAQSYTNWDYTIVNNCSTDGSLEIAQRYAAKDRRIRVVSNDRLMPIIENHNHTIRQISPDSKYCKFVFADDWLYPACIEEMVRAAERQPSVGLVGAYGTDGQNVLWTGVSGRLYELQPPYRNHVVPGPEVCRSNLLGGPYVFGTMTSLLVRSDLIRKRPVFFNQQNLHADQESCLSVLQESDFSFVHQVLSFSRPREQSNGSFAKQFDSIELGDFVIFLRYGPVFLQETDYQKRLREKRREYHRVLAKNILRIRSKEFWEYHKHTLGAFGSQIDRWLLTRLVLVDLVSKLLHPLNTIRRGWRWWSRALKRVSPGNRLVRTHGLP
jgi:glycosyltransferase involved in cell wall biosynthesis